MTIKIVQNKVNPAIFTLLSMMTFMTCAFSMNTIAGDVYKWTDEEGIIHYSDIKPNHSASQKMKVSGGKSTKSRLSAQSQVGALDEAKRKQLETQAQKLQDETYARQVEARCQVVRDSLKKFQENSRIKIKEEGAARYLTPEEIANGFQVMMGKGCPICNDTGYKGRIAFYEVMVFNDSLKELVLQGCSTAELKMEATRGGMQSLRLAGLQKVGEGMTSMEEVLRVTAAD